jgi:predicted amidophosphoribosyltransferase
MYKTDELFRRFKAGEKNLAFPLALGMHEALVARGLESVDAIVPVPLSPDKVAAGEIHRTLLLARELGRQLGVPVRQLLWSSR